MSDCVFCKIAAGELAADIVASDDEFVAFRDVEPRADLHVLVVPRAHTDDLDEWLASGGSSDRMIGFVTDAAAQLGVGGGYRLVTNVGEDAGQIVRHLHWHIMAGPRLPGF